jgi:hypothetical protein
MYKIKEDDIVIITNWYSDLFGKLGRVIKEDPERLGYYVIEFRKEVRYMDSTDITRVMYKGDFVVLKPNKRTREV